MPFDYVAFCSSDALDCPAPNQAELGELAARAIAAAVQRNALIGTAESCTGGLVAGTLTSVSGSSAAVLGGVVSYAPVVKHKLLGVSDTTIANPGVVSAECAAQMCIGAAQALGASHTVSTTGIAGPSGAEPGKPVGTVWFGLHTPFGTRTLHKEFSGDRDAVRAKAVACACALLVDGLTA